MLDKLKQRFARPTKMILPPGIAPAEAEIMINPVAYGVDPMAEFTPAGMIRQYEELKKAAEEAREMAKFDRIGELKAGRK